MQPALPVVLLAAAAAAAPRPAAVSPAERAAAATIRPELLRGHIGFLASDLLEGRGTASRGDRLAQAYVAAQLAASGLQPGAPGGGWLQPVELLGVASSAPERVSFHRGGEALELRSGDDFIAFPGAPDAEVAVQGAELVFVGYGIVAPEYAWDDYAGADVRGKLLLVMNNDPEDDPGLFQGRTRLYYGRWDYKYEEAARHGAAGAIVIHTTPSAGYPWQVVQSSWQGEQFQLPEAGGPQLRIKAWASEDATRRIARLAGQDLDALQAAARRRGFHAVPLGVSLDLSLHSQVRRVETANVIGVLPGRDPALAREAVIFTAHHDHLGMKRDPRPGEDAIYNGARDNASGVATLLAIADAMARLPRAPSRSVYFAAVAAEEQGLLGSRYLAAHPPVPAGRLAADVNVDSVNIWGRSRDVVAIGLGKSNLDDWIRGLAAMQGRRVVPDAFPEKGSFYRSDQLSFARIGVPAAYLSSGVDIVDRPDGWGRAQREAFDATDYHQPSDELRPSWDLSGAAEDARLLFYLGVKLANASRMPAWKPGDEFEAARKKAIAALKPPPSS